jgi:RP/EB family microtubule-associated protein
MAQPEAIGIMDPAFFVGKSVLLKWVNELLQTNIAKVEEMANGAYHCQILDALYPGKVPLQKVNFNAKHEYEFVKNFKVLQDVFTQQGVKKHVDVEKLVKAKYQDNLEFFQWIKNFFDSKYNGTPYAAVERRQQAIAAYGKATNTSTVAVPSTRAAAPATSKPGIKTPGSGLVKKTTPAPAPASGLIKKTGGGGGDRSAEIEELNQKLTKLKATIEGLEKERNFYFGKLRQIEVLCQQDEQKEAETKQKVLKILYATDNDEEFAPPEDPSGTVAAVEAAAEGGEAGEAGAAELLDTSAADGDLLNQQQETL